MGKMQRNKGATFERLIAKMFRETIGVDSEAAKDIKRGLGQARGAGEIADVPVPHLWNECKHHAKCYPLKAYAQAVKAEQEWRERVYGEHGARAQRRIPVAICKSNRATITTTLALDDLARITSGVGWRTHTEVGPVMVTLDLVDFLVLYKRFHLATEPIR